MRDTIPLVAFIGKLVVVLPIIIEHAKVQCTIFEDNNGCIEPVKCQRMRLRTKHIALKYHHFRSEVKEALIAVKEVDTKMQHWGLLTKVLPEPLFKHFKTLIIG